MRKGARIGLVLPALNEERAIGSVLDAVPGWVDEVVVADNGSTDRTPEIASAAGARVVREPRRGYGAACQAGLAALDAPDVVVFLDADYSDDPSEMGRLVDPIAERRRDLVIGSRTLGRRQPGALPPQAALGNWLACGLIGAIWNVRYTDLGPFRAIRAGALRALGMRDAGYGWTVEMQIRAAAQGLRVGEAPVSYRRRIGRSKISGTVRGVVGAGTKILSTVLLSALDRRRRLPPRCAAERLIVFTRYPQPGRTKTRMIPVLGPEGAARLQRRMTAQVTAIAQRTARRRGSSLEVRYEGGDRRRMSRWLGPGATYRPQGAGDLGARMRRALEESFREGSDFAIIIGSDCPAVSTELIGRAFAALRRRDLVLGPAEDGGYYLIGLRRPLPELFGGVDWGTDRVLAQTLRIAGDCGISFDLLETLADVDRPQDLPAWERVAHEPAALTADARISVIVPALDEQDCIGETLRRAAGARHVETVVVDGGSGDATVAVAREQGARVVTAPRGKARQMNAGADAARGELLLFLHADTLLPRGYDRHVRKALADPNVAAGAFEPGFAAAGWGLRAIERLTAFRSGVLRMPYGDQAIFVRAETFRDVGGFPDLPIMEDYELMRRLRRRGRIAIAPRRVAASARRWLRLGVLRTTLTNQLVIAGHNIGVSPARLARWYGFA